MIRGSEDAGARRYAISGSLETDFGTRHVKAGETVPAGMFFGWPFWTAMEAYCGGRLAMKAFSSTLSVPTQSTHLAFLGH